LLLRGHAVRAALYLRVSGGPRQTSANQRPELEAFANLRGFEIVATYDEAVSAAKHRPAFERMMSDARARQFDALLVWSLDRFGRSMVGNLETALELDACGVELISCKESWLQLRGPVRPLLIAVFGWVAEQERLRIAERTRAGLERARREGTRLGRPVTPVDLDAARTLLASGKTKRAVARALRVGEATLARAFEREANEAPKTPRARLHEDAPDSTPKTPQKSAMGGDIDVAGNGGL
jgi:putative DNA-invertase from lambdoid prophage Rac